MELLDITGKARKESCYFPVEGGRGGGLGLLARVGEDVNFNFNFIAINSAGKDKNRKCATEEHLGPGSNVELDMCQTYCVVIRNKQSLTSESITIDNFVYIWVDHTVIFDDSSRLELQKFDFDSDVQLHVPNVIHVLRMH